MQAVVADGTDALSGTFTLGFRGGVSQPISVSSTAASPKARLRRTCCRRLEGGCDKV